MLIKISSEANSQKMGIFIDCGKYGSDWLAMSSCDILIESLLETDQLVDYWIIPVMNPDGYEYTWSTDRLWVSFTFIIVRASTSSAKKSSRHQWRLQWGFPR